MSVVITLVQLLLLSYIPFTKPILLVWCILNLWVALGINSNPFNTIIPKATYV